MKYSTHCQRRLRLVLFSLVISISFPCALAAADTIIALNNNLTHSLVISAKKNIKVAIAHWPPWKIIDNGKFSGIDIDILKAIEAKSDSIKFSFTECPWKRCVEMIRTGDVDLITSFVKKPDREEFTHYIKPPYVSSRAIFFYVHKDGGLAINKYEDLYKYTVGTVKGRAYFKRFDDDTKINKVAVPLEGQLLKMLESKRLDVVIGHDLVYDHLIIKNGLYGKFKKAAFSATTQRDAYIAMSIKSDSQDAIPLISSILSKMINSGEINLIKSSFLKKQKEENH